MLTVEFDETIDSELRPGELWELVVEAFEHPETSPIWPVELESLEIETLREGARVAGSYKLGPVVTEAAYRISHFDEGTSFTYETEETHPLDGGATVEVSESPQGGSVLRWHGSYESGGGVMGMAAIGFVRAYFLETFFSRLRANLRSYEDRG